MVAEVVKVPYRVLCGAG